jgi:hypothetical protein
MIGRRGALSVMLCAVALGACSSTGHLVAVHSGERSSRPSPASRCAGRAPLSAGSVVGGWRLGAIHLFTAQVGAALTADSIPCAVPARSGGEDVNSQTQPLLLAITRDGGRRWVMEGKAPPNPSLASSGDAAENIVGTSLHQIWASTGTGRLWASTTGGRSWTVQPIPAPVVQVATSGR